jgi:putative ABC transport system permease protein
VEEALPRIRTAVLVDGASSNRPGLLLGIDLAREEGYLNPSAMAAIGRLPEAGRPEIMVGREFAEELQVSVGDTITLLGQTAYRSLGGARLAVTGLVVSGMAYFDNTFLIAPLDQVQAMVDLQDATTEIVVFATDPERADELARSIRGELSELSTNPLEVLSWSDQGEIVRMLDMVKPVLGVILFLMLFMACLIIINTMLMTVMERTQEFGMQAALGMRRSDLVKLILAEGLAIGLLGAIAGAVLGSGVGLWLEYNGINVAGATRAIDLPFQGILYPDWKFPYVLYAAAAGMFTAGVAAIYPAWRAVRRTPAEALRA